MNPPNVYELSMPSSHSSIRTTKIVHSMMASYMSQGLERARETAGAPDLLERDKNARPVPPPPVAALQALSAFARQILDFSARRMRPVCNSCWGGHGKEGILDTWLST